MLVPSIAFYKKQKRSLFHTQTLPTAIALLDLFFYYWLRLNGKIHDLAPNSG
ncbi:hypothetical protein [Moorena sp. SIO4G3]|uniref:hypothetical protein n=1 Tax=Moorena sp. SIO4G3 TaxID=2607821 RepID=UPI00142A9402|nr:hypothetical protein [Moorena sp. SIO4G3]NEO80989.1 hypothetical protein [Moorena sp. SIO4G3]